MGYFRSKKGSIISDWFLLCQTIGNFEEGLICDVALYDEYLEITSKGKKNKITLSYTQITDVFRGRISQLSESSVIGSAIAGGILGGKTGAVIGSVAGSKGQVKTKTNKVYLIISYKGSDGEDKYLQFEDYRAYHGKKLARTLRELCGFSGNSSERSPFEDDIEL